MFAGRDASQKAAAKEASAIFQNHYPEFLVRPHLSLLLVCDRGDV